MAIESFDMECVGGVTVSKYRGVDVGLLVGLSPINVHVTTIGQHQKNDEYDSLMRLINTTQPDIIFHAATSFLDEKTYQLFKKILILDVQCHIVTLAESFWYPYISTSTSIATAGIDIDSKHDKKSVLYAKELNDIGITQNKAIIASGMQDSLVNNLLISSVKRSILMPLERIAGVISVNINNPFYFGFEKYFGINVKHSEFNDYIKTNGPSNHFLNVFIVFIEQSVARIIDNLFEINLKDGINVNQEIMRFETSISSIIPENSDYSNQFIFCGGCGDDGKGAYLGVDRVIGLNITAIATIDDNRYVSMMLLVGLFDVYQK